MSAPGRSEALIPQRPARRFKPASGWPNTRTLPVLGGSSPAATLSSVLLPQPVGPTTETNSPAPTSRWTSRTAV